MVAHIDGSRVRHAVAAGGKLTQDEAASFLEALKDIVREVCTDMENGRVHASLRNPDHVFHTIFVEAEQMHHDGQSLKTYMTLFFSFMKRHIDRSLLRIEQYSKE